MALFFLAAGNTPAQAAAPIHFHHLTSDDGLPQVTIRSLIRTRTGQVWAGTEDGLVRLDGAIMKVFKKSARSEASLSDNCISSLAEGPDGSVWAGTLGNGLNVISPDGETIRRVGGASLLHDDILAILPDEHGLWLGTDGGLKFLPYGVEEAKLVPISYQGEPFTKKVKGISRGHDCLWLITKGQGMCRYVPGGEARWFASGEDGLRDKTFNSIYRDTQGRVWAGSENAGLVAIDESGPVISFRHYTKQDNGLGANDVMAMADAGDGRLWIGSWKGGLQLFAPDKGVIATYLHSAANPFSLSSDIIMTLQAGEGPDVWVGTNDRGLSRFDRRQAFKSFTYDPLATAGVPDPLVWAFAQDGEGKLWIGTTKGLTRLDPLTNSFMRPSIPGELGQSLLGESVRAFAPCPGGMWVGTRKKGVVRVDLATWTATSLDDIAGKKNVLGDTDVRLLLNDQEHSALWVGLSDGLARYDLASGAVTRFRHDPKDPATLPHDRIRGLYKDRKGHIWIGTSLGLARLRQDGSGFDVWNRDPALPDSSLAGDGVRGMAEDDAGRYWICTEMGISLFTPEQGVIRNIREEDGLPNNAVYGIVYSGGFMWASTMRGLARIDPGTMSVQHYYKRDGLPDNEFNFNAWGRLDSGELVFGGVNGFTHFAPGEVPCPENARNPPRIALAPLPGENGLPIPINGELKLGWQAPNIAFRFSALAFDAPGNISYRVRLLGAETAWRETSEMGAVYAGLSPGRYAFEVTARDAHGQWAAGPETLSFTVAAPPWMRWPAFVAYALILVTLMVLMARMAAGRQRRRAAWLEQEVVRRSVQLAESNALLEERNQSLAQLIDSRERLFRSIAHELRTPLSVIITALENNIEAYADKGRQASQLALRSAERLSSLIKAILDVARGKSRRRETVFDAGKALDDTLAPFRLLAQTQGKHLMEDIESSRGLWLRMDREMFIASVGNLLSNSFKYGGPEVRLEVVSHDASLVVAVTDDGEGIAEEDLPRVFEWFARGTSDGEGWGIGLPTAREAVEKFGGSLSARRSPEGGMRFEVVLPLTEQPTDTDAFDSMEPTAGMDPAVFAGKSIVLVEDDPDLRSQLAGIFAGLCEVREAGDEEEAWRAVSSEPPSLVISDVMLPGASGFDLVREIKENIDTCHVPVILISAYDEEELSRSGYSVSADACLGKPFKPSELLLRAASLLKNRELAAQRLKRAVLFEPEAAAAPSTGDAESEFLQRIRQAMTPLELIAELSLADVADRVGMSQRSLQRAFEKSGLNWREFKRLHQLRQAMTLLRSGDVNITEVAMSCGFTSSAYFSKVFREHVGMTPSEWRAKESA